jgi:hypothetical protein
MKPRQPSSLPKGWSKYIKSSLLHAIALATTALTDAWSGAAAGRSMDTKLDAELDRVNIEFVGSVHHTPASTTRADLRLTRARPRYTRLGSAHRSVRP